MPLLRSLRITGTDVLQICRAYGAGFTIDFPASPAAGLAKDAARVAPSPWGEGRVEGGRETNYKGSLFAGLPYCFANCFSHETSSCLPQRRIEVPSV